MFELKKKDERIVGFESVSTFDIDTQCSSLQDLINSRIIDNQLEFIFYARNFGYGTYETSVVYHIIPLNILKNGKQRYQIGEKGEINLDCDDSE